MTSGASLNELARELLSSGAISVYALALARAQAHQYADV